MVVDALLLALGDWDRDLRQAAAEALGRVADRRAVEPLVARLQDADEWVRQSTERALHALGWRPETTSPRGVLTGMVAA